MTTFQPDGPRADAAVFDVSRDHVTDWLTRTGDPAADRSYFWEADADSAAYAAADELGHIEKYATADEVQL